MKKCLTRACHHVSHLQAMRSTVFVGQLCLPSVDTPLTDTGKTADMSRGER